MNAEMNLRPVTGATVAGGGQPVASADTSVFRTGCPNDLRPNHMPAANSRGVSVAAPEATGDITETPTSPSPAAGGNVRSSLLLTRNKECEAKIIAAARKVVIQEILALLGKDVPSPRHHKKYLQSIPFGALCERRDTLKREIQPELFQPKREPLQVQPELFDKYDRAKKYFGATRGGATA